MRGIFLFLLLGAPAAAQQIDTLALRAHTRILADDALQGRGTGTAGERFAALYIESQLIALGAQPVNGRYQHAVPIKRARLVSSTLTVRQQADSTSFGERDFVVNTGGPGALRNFEGEGLFVGTVEHALESLRRTTAALRGKVVVVLGTLGPHAAVLIPEWTRAGAAGVVLTVPDSTQFQLFARSRGNARYFVDAPVDDPIWQADLPAVIAGPRLYAALVSSLSVIPAPLGKTISVRLSTETERISAANVTAVIPGTDPVRRGEYVLYTAHYDHLGISAPDARGDSIYNGFSDNAAGVAMLLAIARAFGERPAARSIMFAFFTGEERGLLGSNYFAARPPVPLGQIVGVINLDAGAPPGRPVDWRLAGGAANTIGHVARDLAIGKSWRVELGDASPNSDYWPFHARGVPAVFLIPGGTWEGLTTAQRDSLRARWDRYHRADDEWSADFPFAGLQRYAEFALEIGRAVAQGPRPRLLIR